MVLMERRQESTCGCAPHCVTHEATGRLEEIDCAEALLVYMKYRLAAIARHLADLTVTDRHPDSRALVEADLVLAVMQLDLAVRRLRSETLGRLAQVAA